MTWARTLPATSGSKMPWLLPQSEQSPFFLRMVTIVAYFQVSGRCHVGATGLACGMRRVITCYLMLTGDAMIFVNVSS